MFKKYPVGSVMNYPSIENNYLLEHATLLAKSFYKLRGHRLIQHDTDNITQAKEMFQAKFALLSHTNDADPIFNYANQTALELFEFNWDELITLPSKLSAEPINQVEREKLLQQVTAKGYIDNYQGVRISKTGKRFQISHAIVWNLIDDDGVYQGQAACFSDWEYL